MKISSKTDVVTNSSDEVFVLVEDKGLTLQEITKWIRSKVPGCMDPEVLDKHTGCLEWLINFGYLVDPEDQRSIGRYLVHEVFCKPTNIWWDSDDLTCHEEKVKGGSEINEAWKRYLIKNMGRINSEYRKKHPGGIYIPIPSSYQDSGHYNMWRGDVWYDDLPEGFVKEFLDQYQGVIPETADIPSDFNANQYVGKIGFRSESENSVSEEEFEKIYEKLGNVRHWHMG